MANDQEDKKFEYSEDDESLDNFDAFIRQVYRIRTNDTTLNTAVYSSNYSDYPIAYNQIVNPTYTYDASTGSITGTYTYTLDPNDYSIVSTISKTNSFTNSLSETTRIKNELSLISEAVLYLFETCENNQKIHHISDKKLKLIPNTQYTNGPISKLTAEYGPYSVNLNFLEDNHLRHYVCYRYASSVDSLNADKGTVGNLIIGIIYNKLHQQIAEDLGII